jgi:hypothetical protein
MRTYLHTDGRGNDSDQLFGRQMFQPDLCLNSPLRLSLLGGGSPAFVHNPHSL